MIHNRKRQKANSPEKITWSELGKQNIQAKRYIELQSDTYSSKGSRQSVCDPVAGDGHTRQRLRFSIPEVRYSPLEFNSGKIFQHWTNRTRWNKRDEV